MFSLCFIFGAHQGAVNLHVQVCSPDESEEKTMNPLTHNTSRPVSSVQSLIQQIVVKNPLFVPSARNAKIDKK